MQRFQILCLTGGGYRGLYTASLIERLENHFEKKIGDCFDLICGTSIGGVIATAIAFGKTATDIKERLLYDGEKIFSKPTCGLFRPKYCSCQLEKSIRRLLPDDPKIKEALHPYLTTAVNLHSGRPRIFKTPHDPRFFVDGELSAVSAALATSAAPLFFPPAKVETDYFIDGGLFANAPELVGLHEATHFLQVPKNDIHILSIGTTNPLAGVGYKKPRKWGLIDWTWPDQKIIELTFSAQQEFAINMLTHNLGPRYVRIDENHSGDESFKSAMDDASYGAVKNMEMFASRSFMRISGRQEIVEFFNHNPNRSGLDFSKSRSIKNGNM